MYRASSSHGVGQYRNVRFCNVEIIVDVSLDSMGEYKALVMLIVLDQCFVD